MKLLQKIRAKRDKRELKRAIKKYNAVVKELAAAADVIRELARKNGLLTKDIEVGVTQIHKAADKTTISERDFEKEVKRHAK